mmetsp:Transcript_144745/g.360900  ORF Transcript_144745/g.360900 Transcript_144745/m.360900 type:complete len:348 (+) Transcript_144745:128-1171(+)
MTAPPEFSSYSQAWKEAFPWNYALSSALSTTSGGSGSSPGCGQDDSWTDDFSTHSGSCHWMVLGMGSLSMGRDSKVAAPANQQAGKRHWMLSVPTEKRASLTSQAKPFVPKAHWMVHGVPFVPKEVAPVPEDTPAVIPEAQTQKTWEWSTAAEDLLNSAIAVVTGGATTGAQAAEEKEELSAEEAVATHAADAEQEQHEPLASSVRSIQFPLQVKHTFIHYRDAEDSPRHSGLKRSHSAPVLLGGSGLDSGCADVTEDVKHSMTDTVDKVMHDVHQEVHDRGACKPCAYFHQKEDGCRWGIACEFCHVCLPGEIKKRKREKVKAMKANKISSTRSMKPALIKPRADC